jgi:hypothetical protein
LSLFKIIDYLCVLCGEIAFSFSSNMALSFMKHTILR